jgi:hypothetical protein
MQGRINNLHGKKSFALMGIAYDLTGSYDAGYIVLVGVAAVTVFIFSQVKKTCNPDLDLSA